MPSSSRSPDPGAEGEHRGVAGLDLVGVAKILEDVGHGRQQHRHRLASLVRPEHRRAAKRDVTGEDLVEGGEVLALGRRPEQVALHAGTLARPEAVRSRPTADHTRGYARADEPTHPQGPRRRVRLRLSRHPLRRDPRRLVRRPGRDGRRDPVPRERDARPQRPARAARGGRAPLRAVRRRSARSTRRTAP